MSRLPAPCVYAVSSRRRLAPDARTAQAEVRALQRWLDDVVGSGVDMIQIRERDLPSGQLCAVVQHAVACTAGTATKIVINDRADVALVGGAHGVHLPSSGMPVSVVRRLDSQWLLGRSVHVGDPPSASEGADYVVFGTVYPSRSKAEPLPGASGLEALRAFAAGTACPVIAIGGMTPDRAAACVSQGAVGAAAIGLFLPMGTEPEALGPAAAARALRRAMLECRDVGM